MPDALTRRTFLAAALGSTVALAQPPVKTPVTGTADPALATLDALMTAFVEENRVPGAALALSRGGKLVYARGFGYADVEKKEPVQPAALFRLASISKPITAAAVMRLVEQGKFKLDDTVVDLMKLEGYVPPDGKPDPRWARITVRQCLQHSGGWDRDKSPDPIGRAWDIAKALGSGPPVRPDDVVRYMMGQPLDFDPGERYAYSNLGYLVLGRIIEQATKQDYEASVRKEVFAPLGITAPQLGKARAEQRAAGEVCYYDAKNRTGPALVPPKIGEIVPLQYGAQNLEGYAAHGGWIASAVDLVKFASAFDDPARCPILSAKSIAEQWRRPAGGPGHDAGKPKLVYYAAGWNVRPRDDGTADTWHGGFIAGSETMLHRRHDGVNWAVLFNTHHNPDGKSLSKLIDPRLEAAIDAIKTWPTADQFGQYLEMKK